MEISQNIVTQMKMKNNLLKSLHNNIDNEREYFESQQLQLQQQFQHQNHNHQNHQHQQNYTLNAD